MTRDIPPGLRAQLDAPSFQGPATFGMRPFLTEPAQLDEWKPDVAVVGAPWDDNTTNRPGARFGPRALRANAYDPGTYHLDLGIEIFDHLDVVDYGDAIISHGMWEQSKAAIYERVSDITSRGIVPVLLGGDHSVTWPAGIAVAEKHGFGNVVMIHFDAHADTANEIEGNSASHGVPMRRLIESGAIPGDRFIQVGLRGYWPGEEDQKWMRDNGLTHFMMQEFWERGTKAVMADVIAAAQAKGGRVYISIDIDVLDPGFAPATGTPEPGGFAPIDLLRIVRQLVLETDVVALDVMEVAPAYDHADITVNN
ncbi:MAG TPA: agmatinase, partial [Candidatus Limnocylindrales bacterium]|nr:agmatinase [Candidatus Limnocylindrales bacterium]